MENEPKYCNFCNEEIKGEPLICPNCNSYFPTKKKAKKWFLWIGIAIKFIIPIFIISITIFQLGLATIEKRDAKDAKSIAKETKENLDERMEKIKAFQANQLRIQDKITFAFFYTNQGQYIDISRILPLKSFGNGTAYHDISFLNIASAKNIKITTNNRQRYYFDLFEMSFFDWYQNTFYSHWIRNDKIGSNPFIDNGKLSASFPQMNSMNSEIIKLHGYLNDNICLPYLKNHANGMIIPPKTKFSTSRDNTPRIVDFSPPLEEHLREIDFENSRMKLLIRIANTVPYGGFQEHEAKMLGIDKYFATTDDIIIQTITINFNASFKTDTIDEMSFQQHEWISQFITLFKKEYDWFIIKNEL